MSHNPFLSPDPMFLSHSKQEIQKKLHSWYFDYDIQSYNQSLFDHPEDFWHKLGQEKALNLFHQAAQAVPAYKDFLQKNQINPDSIHTYDDLNQVPPVNKENYISQYPLQDLAWHGKLDSANIVSFSSGSTGNPYFWPRGSYQDFEGAFAFEHMLTYLFQIHKKSTLMVNCFSMGNYVAGVYVLSSVKLLAQKGYDITIVSPGINYQDAFNVLKPLADKYDQIILCGYPPFLRDLLELSQLEDFDFTKYHVRFFFASEFFSEVWRDTTLELANTFAPVTDSTNIYGTADAAIFNFETPTTIVIRKLAEKFPDLNQALFQSQVSPTLVQYNPAITHYNVVDNQLTLTTTSGLPFIRYNLKDQGNLLSYSQIAQKMAEFNIDLEAELHKYGIRDTLFNLPFAYLTNRTDGAVSFYAILISPSYVREGVESIHLRDFITGKFSLVSGHNRQMTPKLTVHLELKLGVKETPDLKKLALKHVVESLRKNCSEYSFLEQSIGKKAKPHIKFHAKGTSKYFQVGIKQKWISNE